MPDEPNTPEANSPNPDPTPNSPDPAPASDPAPAPGPETPPPADAPPAAQPDPVAGNAPPPTGGGDPADDPASLADGGGGPDEQPDAAAPSSWPENWRHIAAAGDPRVEQYLNRYNSPGNVVKALMATRQKISSGEMIAAKPDGSDAEALNNWRAQVGIPEKPEGYLEKLPDGLVIGEADKPIIDGFIARMHDKDTPPHIVHEAVKWYYDHQEDVLASRAEADRSYRAQSEDSLRADFGPEFRGNINQMKTLMREYFGDDVSQAFFSARTPDGKLFGDNPGIIQGLVRLAREIDPPDLPMGGQGSDPGTTISTRLGELRTLMADTKSEYYNGPNSDTLQAEYRTLTDHEEKLKTRGAR